MYGWAIALAILGISSFNATAQDSSELRARAEMEIRQVGQVQTRSTDAQVSESMLHLENPEPKVSHRAWDYFTTLSVQSFTPNGSGGNDLVDSRFDMHENGATVMPALAFGFRATALKRETWSLLAGLGGRFSYAAQKGNAHFTNGYEATGSSLVSTLIAAAPTLSVTLARWPKWMLNLGGEYGSLNYTQTGNNKMANFAEHANYFGASAGLEYQILSFCSVLTTYTHRTLSETSHIGLQPDNYEMGTRITW